MMPKHTTSTLLTCVADATSYTKCVYLPVNSAMSPQSGIARPDSSLVSLIYTVPSEYSSKYCTVPVYHVLILAVKLSNSMQQHGHLFLQQ
jgi:hypothetical protein